MSKRNIILICVAVAVVIIIAFVVYFAIANSKTNNSENVEKVIITKYNDNFELEKSIEITNKKQIKEIKEICENPSDILTNLAIRNDVKVNLNNGIILTIQLNLEEYCYYEDSNSNTEFIIKMPEGLLEKVNTILAENS